ncbi:unnamed protein product [Symbiodinium natans]|uniref:Uncharacterized protein n=1 Tax=Symbiodinium natans TaxID=878477 RepID=A0A812M4I3_9DINO|nr:unnamed protein product [Symbiodinium natans]
MSTYLHDAAKCRKAIAVVRFVSEWCIQSPQAAVAVPPIQGLSMPSWPAIEMFRLLAGRLLAGRCLHRRVGPAKEVDDRHHPAFSDLAVPDPCRVRPAHRPRKSWRDRQAAMNLWLDLNGFGQDVAAPRSVKSVWHSISPRHRGNDAEEVIYPIHLAAASGDHRLLRCLLLAGADGNQRTSKGRLAVELAEELNTFGSHDSVITQLQSQAKVKRVTDILSGSSAEK